MADIMVNEKTPLLAKFPRQRSERCSSGSSTGDPSVLDRGRSRTITSSVRIHRHISLFHAIGIMVGTVAGTGIFISPTGVTQQVGSIGATFIMWAFNGLLNLVLALCYSELGTALPLAGGDYAYLNYVMGPLPAFLCLWLMVVLLGPGALTLTARTVAAYLTTTLGLECYTLLSVMVSIWVIIGGAALNVTSSQLSSRLVTIFSIGKVIAMGVIVISGIVRLGQGFTENFEKPFAYSVTDPAAIMVSFLPAFVSYSGWDIVTVLAEEMTNPVRDLPIATVVSMILVTCLYILMNVAYFTALTPPEFIKTDAVATLYAQKVMPSVSFLIPVFVILSATGSMLNLTLACPRIAFAGGRDGALPKLLSFIHIRRLTPIPSIFLTASLTVLYCMAVFFDIQDLLNIMSLITQTKMILTLTALLILKYREPDKPSTLTVPTVVVILAVIILIAFTLLPLWQTPAVAITAFGIFLAGIPLYYLKGHLGSWSCCNKLMNRITQSTQLFLQVVQPAAPTT